MYTLCLMPTLRNHFNSPSLSVIIIHVTKRYCFHLLHSLLPFFFFFNDTATTEIYTLSLHDALPIFLYGLQARCVQRPRLMTEIRMRRPRSDDQRVITKLTWACLPAQPDTPTRQVDRRDRKSTRLNSSHT